MSSQISFDNVEFGMSSLPVVLSANDRQFRVVCDSVLADSVFDSLYSKLGREARSQALHFDLQLRHPSRDRHRKSITPDGQPRTLEDEWEEFAGEYDLPAGLDRIVFSEKGRDYLGKMTLT